MPKKYRVGDLVKYTNGYINGRSNDIYCKVVAIKDKEKNIYSEYDIVTGHGDQNSKVLLDLKAIAKCKDLSKCDLEFKNLDPHKVFNNYKYNLKRIKKEIKFLKKKKEFYLKNENILDKIDKILK